MRDVSVVTSCENSYKLCINHPYICYFLKKSRVDPRKEFVFFPSMSLSTERFVKQKNFG
jgi:hypothetical protein